MENNNIENKIFLSIKDKIKTLSHEEVEKIIIEELKSNGYENWSIDYAVERIKKITGKEATLIKDKTEQIPNTDKSKKRVSIGVSSAIILYVIYRMIVGVFSDSQSNIIAKVVKQEKNNITLPYQVDEITTLTDITAEPNAIRFYYVISDSDLNNKYPQFNTDDELKEYMLSKACINEHYKSVLDQGINLEYSTIIEKISKTLFVSLTKDDCLNYKIPSLEFKDFDLKKIEVEQR